MNKNILISIYPKYIEKILTGEKNFEFRPFVLKTDYCNIFWVYETSPVKSLKYKMTVKNPITKLKNNQSYFLGNQEFERLISDGKYAYEIIHIDELVLPINLNDLNEMGVTAPQGYAYLTKYPHLFNTLKNAKLKKIF